MYFFWCQIERAARLRLGNPLHLHAIRNSKTWNDSDKTSMTAGNFRVDFFQFLIAWSVKTWWGDHLFLRGGLEIFWARISCFLISAGPVLTLYLAHSHCDKKYVNLNKWLWYQNFYFRQRSQLILAQNISSPPSQKQMVTPSCFDTSCYEKLEKV
jgi:hypothetical protein